ncbi:hypothetical protein [Actinocatenispora comari]|uniref:Uncharacterized protein n=1 Tax=Actinocatenispora comari TaxID=2807577 RepID=A0A8J4ELE2_9ACTN|nr:hypothetical protein [Actinocatenispora comari]GIL29182.1 hypothetical protein NUM_44360 [Actinocatenispora comari]
MATDRGDKQQIGLTLEGNNAIETVSNEYFGGSQKDAYLFAITYAIGADLAIENAPQGGYTTKYNGIGTLDPSGSVRELLEILNIGEPGRPMATMERLAELGVRDLARRVAGNETMADIMASVAAE